MKSGFAHLQEKDTESRRLIDQLPCGKTLAIAQWFNKSVCDICSSTVSADRRFGEDDIVWRFVKLCGASNVICHAHGSSFSYVAPDVGILGRSLALMPLVKYKLLRLAYLYATMLLTTPGSFHANLWFYYTHWFVHSQMICMYRYLTQCSNSSICPNHLMLLSFTLSEALNMQNLCRTAELRFFGTNVSFFLTPG